MQVDLAAALVTNYSEINATMAASPRIVAHDDPGCRWISSDIPAPAVNMVISDDLPDALAAQQIARVIAHFKAANLPFQWRVGAQTEASVMETRLVAAGLTTGARWPVMGYPLAYTPPQLELPGVQIVPVVDEIGLRIFYDVLAVSFPAPVGLNDLYMDVYVRPKAANTRHWLVYRDGQPVATGQMHLGSEGLAGLYRVSTIPAARGGGFGRAVTLVMMQEAQAAGYRWIVLAASGLGEPMYRKLGYIQDGWMTNYVWQPDVQP